MSAPKAGPANDSDRTVPNVSAQPDPFLLIQSTAETSYHAEVDVNNPSADGTFAAKTTSPAIVKKIAGCADDDATATAAW